VSRPRGRPGDVEVDFLREDDRSVWDAYAAAHPRGTFFHQSAWRSVVSAGLKHRTHYMLARRADGSLCGILPLAEIASRFFGRRLVSVPGAVYGGTLASSSEAANALIAAAAELAERLRVDALELRHGETLDGSLLTTTPGVWQRSDLYVTFRREISRDEDTNLKAIPRKQRAMVRKGIAAGLYSETTTDVARFYRIYAESVRNLGTPVLSIDYFRTLLGQLDDAVEITMVKFREADVATVMSFYFHDEVHPYYGGSRPIARELKANDFMYWDLMSRAARRGVRVFDFGRSKVETGSYHFKKNWGFSPEPLYYRSYVMGNRPSPDVNPMNPKYRLLIAGWKKLPLPVANAVGPALARNLV